MLQQQAMIDAVSRIHGKLAQMCDTGFALAIHIRYTRPSLLYRTYSQAWIDHYSEKGFMLTDPVVHWALQNSGWVWWDDLADQDPEGVLRDAKAFGLMNGWTYSMGESTSRTITGITRSGEKFTTDEVDQIIAMTHEIHALTAGIENFAPEVMDALRALG